MNFKKVLSPLIISITLFVGCSNYQAKNITLPSEATKQNTMTKVQNNVNEIIDKDYKYVLSNLGQPNVTSYVIDKDDVYKLTTVSDIEKIKEVNLVYLKDVSNEEIKKSALILNLKDEKVKKVQIADYSTSAISEGSMKSKMIINCYADSDIVNLDSLKDKNLESFIGIDSIEMDKIVENKKVSYDAYLFDKTKKSANVYKLNENNKLLVIFTENNKISDIKIFSNVDEVINTIKDDMINK